MIGIDIDIEIDPRFVQWQLRCWPFSAARFAINMTTCLQLELLGGVQLIVDTVLIDIIESAGKEKVSIHMQMCTIFIILHLLLLLDHLLVGHNVIVIMLIATHAEFILHIVQMHMVMVMMMLLFSSSTQLLPQQHVRRLGSGVAALLLRCQRRQRINRSTTFGRLCQETLQYLKRKNEYRLLILLGQIYSLGYYNFKIRKHN